jgi:hypothetical protein
MFAVSHFPARRFARRITVSRAILAGRVQTIRLHALFLFENFPDSQSARAPDD